MKSQKITLPTHETSDPSNRSQKQPSTYQVRLLQAYHIIAIAIALVGCRAPDTVDARTKSVVALPDGDEFFLQDITPVISDSLGLDSLALADNSSDIPPDPQGLEVELSVADSESVSAALSNLNEGLGLADSGSQTKTSSTSTASGSYRAAKSTIEVKSSSIKGKGVVTTKNNKTLNVTHAQKDGKPIIHVGVSMPIDFLSYFMPPSGTILAGPTGNWQYAYVVNGSEIYLLKSADGTRYMQFSVQSNGTIIAQNDTECTDGIKSCVGYYKGVIKGKTSWAPGQKITSNGTQVITKGLGSCAVKSSHPLTSTETLVGLETANVGGTIGVQTVAHVTYQHPQEGCSGVYTEHNFYAKGYGQIQWFDTCSTAPMRTLPAGSPIAISARFGTVSAKYCNGACTSSSVIKGVSQHVDTSNNCAGSGVGPVKPNAIIAAPGAL